MKRSNRLTVLIPALAILLSSLALGTFADEGQDAPAPDHEHSFTYTVITPATCTEDGMGLNECECGESEDVIIPAAHSFVSEITEATCTAPSIEILTCEACGTVEETELSPALGHSFDEWQTVIPSTCTEDGKKERICSACGEKEEEVLPAAHTFEQDAVYFPGSCTEDERTEQFCSACQQNIITVITAAPGHDWSGWSITVTPTCITEGEEMHTCLECLDFEKRAVPVTEHPFGEWVTTKDATYLENGEKVRTCTFCGGTENGVIEMLANPFTDVKTNKWYTTPILHCLQYGYMVGTTDTAFSLSQPVTRATIVQIMAKLAGADLEAEEYQNSVFTDVANGKWYTAAITWANKNGMASGIGNNSFGYKNNVTREEIAVFLKKLAEFTGRDVEASGAFPGSYEDLDRVHSWAYDALDWAFSAGVMHGSTAKHISPRIQLTRAQLAEMIYSFDTLLPLAESEGEIEAPEKESIPEI